MTTADHSDVPYVEAAGFTKGRADGPPIWVVVHDMEAHETPTTAEATAAYFARGADGRNVSSHYCVDNDSVVQCVRLGDVAWTVGNRPGNYRGINWELAGFASQTRAQWLDDFGRSMLALVARIAARDMREYKIPNERRTVAELQAFRAGITSHNDLRLAFGGTTHTDPGPNFPWDHLHDLLEAELTGNTMALTDADVMKIWTWDLHNGPGEDPAYQVLNRAAADAAAAKAGVDRILGMLAAGLTPEQLATIAAAAEAGAEKGVDDALDGATITTTIDVAEPTP